MTMNGAGIPKGPTSTAEIAGPAANPATSTAISRPRLFPNRSGSARITMRRIDGIAIPTPMPITNRPASSGTKLVENAISRSPTTLSATPVRTRCRAWPRSASGAISSWERKPAKNPMPITAPSADSPMPYSSRKSSSIVNSTPYPAPRNAINAAERPQHRRRPSRFHGSQSFSGVRFGTRSSEQPRADRGATAAGCSYGAMCPASGTIVTAACGTSSRHRSA